MDVYSLNPNILPGDPILHEKHHRLVVVMLVLACLVVVIIFSLWWAGTRVTNTIVPSQPQTDPRLQMAAILRNSVTPVSVEEINKMAAVLSKTKTTVTAAERQSMANTLRGAIPQ